MKFKPLLLLGWLVFATPSLLFSQQGYRDHQEIGTALKALASKYKANVKLVSLTKTLGKNDIWALSLSSGKVQDHPAIAIVGGIEGSHLLGTELALHLAENILANHKEVLNHTSFYIFPNMSPDASQQYFGKLKYARNGNARATDDDRDGSINEDGFEDLNNDGLITLMRIEDPTGDHMIIEEDARIMTPADTKKGEKGTHKLISEGIDNDKDGKFNEDGPGGIAFNKNLSYNFPYFKPGAGEHPVSEKEHRALLDYLYQQWNIYSIISFGPANNLSTPIKFNKANAKKRVVTSILKKDADLNKALSERYNKIIKAKDAPKWKSQGGDFFEWSYFHFGRLALSTPGWWLPKAKGDSINKAPKNKYANFLMWAKEEGHASPFVDWEEVLHPDFPNQKVEVGGINTFMMKNPAYEKVAEIAKAHTDFVLEIAKGQAAISLVNLKTESLGSGLTRISVDLYNSGLLPTHTEMGAKSRWLRKINLTLKLSKGQELISGKKHQTTKPLEGDSSRAFTWLIKGKGNIELKAGAPHTGVKTLSIKL